MICDKISEPKGGVAKPYRLERLRGHGLEPPSLRPGNDMQRRCYSFAAYLVRAGEGHVASRPVDPRT